MLKLGIHLFFVEVQAGKTVYAVCPMLVTYKYYHYSMTIIITVQCFFSAIATVLVKHGTLKKGSIVLADDTFAKVTLYYINRACLNSWLLTAFSQVIRSCSQEKCYISNNGILL